MSVGEHHNKELADIKQTVYSNETLLTCSCKVTYSQQDIQKGPSK